MKKLLLLLFTVIILSCGSAALKPTIAKPEKFENLGTQFNTPLTSEVGTNMINIVHGAYLRAVEITKGSKSTKYHFKGEIKVGDKFIRYKETPEYDIYLCPSMSCMVGFALSKADKSQKMVYNNGMSLSLFDLLHPVEYNEVTHIDANETAFQQQFVYNGKVGNNIKFMYREYKNDMARPAFTQELQYDLSESNIIGFKGMRIEVIKATNTNIEYKILNGFTS